MSCSCDGLCACIIRAADSSIEVEGAGTPTSPYLLRAVLPDFSDLLTVEDTTTVNMQLSGAGTEASPFVLRAESSIALVDLSDVDDIAGPVAGDSPVWVVTGGVGAWKFQPAPPAPAGAVNVSTGLSGLGSVPDPIKVDVSGVFGVGPLAGFGVDSTVGQPIYEDSAGQLRARPLQNIPWSAIVDEPNFSLVGHTHVASDITDPLNLDVGKINGKKIKTTANSSVPPAVGALGLWFWPKGT